MVSVIKKPNFSCNYIQNFTLVHPVEWSVSFFARYSYHCLPVLRSNPVPNPIYHEEALYVQNTALSFALYCHDIYVSLDMPQYNTL